MEKEIKSNEKKMEDKKTGNSLTSSLPKENKMKDKKIVEKETEAKQKTEKKEIMEDKKEDKEIETKKDKKEDKEIGKKPKIKKEFAIALGKNLHISKKQGMYICKFIKGKRIDKAMEDLGDVKLYKKAVPFKGEIPHRKGKGMMSGRYPIKAAEIFVNVLKSLKGNSIVNGFELENTVISNASASWAARPARKGNRRAKRTNVILESREINVGQSSTNHLSKKVTSKGGKK